MKGILYGVGMGPGDPELITHKAVRIIKDADIIALPESGSGNHAALTIAKKVVPLEQKEFLYLNLPMTRDLQELTRCRQVAANEIEKRLEKGKNVAFLTLGDPSIYSTYLYLHKLVKENGFETQIIPGVPSFCAAAAALGEGLCEEKEVLHVIPASYKGMEEALDLTGTKVLMKAGRAMEQVKSSLKDRGLLSKTSLVINCGMEGEQVYPTLEKEDPTGGYFSLFIVKDQKEE